MLNNIQKISAQISHGLPPLVAIAITEIVNIEMSAFSPLGGVGQILVWQILQGLVGWVFGWFSDKHWRKNVLIIAQLLGVVGGVALILFGFNPYVMVLMGLTFAPLPVSRAALMDAYPNFSMTKIIATTFFAQWLPWAFYGYLTKIDYLTVIYFVLAALLINSVLTFLYFREDKERIKELNEKKEHLPTLRSLPSWKQILLTLLALGCAEVTFFLIIDKLEAQSTIRQLWWPSIGFMTFLGNIVAMFYRSGSLSTLLSGCYLIGSCFCVGALFNLTIGSQSASEAITTALISYSLIGGLYLPLAYSFVLSKVGILHRGAACGALDMVELIAALGATVILQPMHLGDWQILVVFAFLYLFAAVIQKYISRNPIKTL